MRSTASRSPSRRCRWARVTPSVRAREPSATRGDVLVLSGDNPLLTTELLGELVETHRRAGAAATVLSFVPADARSTAASSATRAAASRAIVEAATRRRSELALARGQLRRSTSSGATAVAVLDRLEPQNAQGELYLTDAVRALVDAGGRGVAVTSRPTPPRRTASTPVPSSLRRPPCSATGSTSPTCARRHDRRPGLDLDRAGVDDRGRRVVHPSRSCAARRASRPAPRSGRTPSPSTPSRSRRPGRALLLPSPGDGARGSVEGRHVRGDQELTDRGANEGAAPLYIGDAEIGEDTNIAAGTITVNFPHEPAAEGEDDDRAQRPGRCRNAFVAPVTVGDDAWTAAGRSSRTMSPRNARLIPRAPGKPRRGRGGKRDD